MFNGYRVSIWEDEKVLEIDGGDGCSIMLMYLMPWVKWEHFMFCVFYFNNFLKKFICLCISFWLGWVFIAACGLSVVVVSRGDSLLWRVGSRHAGFSSCGTRTQ